MPISQAELDAVSTPSTSQTRIGELRFTDGVADAETADTVYDHLDLVRGVDAFLNAFQGVSMLAIRRGFRDAGVADGDVVIFSDLMDSHSLFLTGNADTVYYLTGLDLSKGPVVIEPRRRLGTVNDMWFPWVIDIGGPGPDRGLGGKYLIVGPDYDGPLPEGGYFIGAFEDQRVCLYAARAFVDNDPSPPCENQGDLKIYPYEPGAFGTSIAQLPERRGAARRRSRAPDDSSSRAPAVVQHHTAERLRRSRADQRERPEGAGHQLRRGARRPARRHRHRQGQGVQAGRADERSCGGGRVRKGDRPGAQLALAPKSGLGYYDEGSTWGSMLWQAALHSRPRRRCHADGVKPLPPTGARTLNSRTAFYYGYTLDSPGMIMRITGRRLAVPDGLLRRRRDSPSTARRPTR